MRSPMDLLKAGLPAELKRRIKRLAGRQDMESRLANLRQAGFDCAGAVDVGAYHGEWARAFREVWKRPLIMIEPQSACRPRLEEIGRASGDVPTYIETCALGADTGRAHFLLEETNSRFARSDSDAVDHATEVEVRTLDGVLGDHMERFNLLKLDVQGFELDVLDGARERLSQFEVVILEVSVIPIGGVPTFLKVMQSMDERGFVLYDFIPMYYRPLDNALWQGDAFFARRDSHLVSSLEWD